MWRFSLLMVVSALLLSGVAQAQMFDITNPGDPLVGVPDDNNWPGAEQPPNAIDDEISTKYLCFKTSFIPDGATGASGFRVTPSGPQVVVKALNFAAANDAAERDPIAFTFSGSDESIDGPYTLIAEGTIDELNAGTALARNTWISTPVLINNRKAYKHYELMFTELRDRGAANSMQIAEVELLSDGSLAGGAGAPSPADETIDIPRDIALGWLAGEMAATHDVYFGTVFDDVNNATRTNPMGVLVSEAQTDAAYDPDGLLEYGQTYYWRVDEVNSAPDYTIFTSDVWSFTVEPFAYPVENIIATVNATSDPTSGLEKTIDGSGLDDADLHSIDSADMWLGLPDGADPISIQYEFDSVYKMHQMLVWNYNVQFELMLGFGLKDVTVEYSENGTDWTILEEAVFAQATARPAYAANTVIDFGGAAVKYVKLTVNSGYGPLPQYGLSEIRFLYIPAAARKPQPADGDVDTSVATDLNWQAGREAVSHEVYFGTDPEALALTDTVSGTSSTPGTLDLATVYYWQINEVNETDEISVWPSKIWSFTTQRFLVVDDFESYTDDEGSRIYESWVDGYGVSSNGSTVGHLESPFAEQTIVKNGSQSMPLFYDNAGTSTSEAELTLAQNWSASGIQSLSLSFYGDAANSGGQLYVKINNTKIVYDGSAINLTRPTWNLWNIDLSTAGNVSSVSSLTIGVEGAGANGVLYIDDVQLYPEVLDYHRAPDITAAGDTVQGFPNDGDWPDIESPDLAIDDDNSTKYLHRKGGAETTGLQITPAMGATIVTGLTLTTANDSPGRDPITFELSGSNAGIDGPYELIAAGDVVDFSGEAEWPRFAKNETLITFDNDVAYTHYQIVFPALRDESEALMQIAEVELIGSAP